MHAFRLFVFLIPFTAHALELPLSQVAARVKSHHPQLKAARMAVEQARGRQLGSGRLANPSAEASFQSVTRFSPQTVMLGIDQAFPLTKRLTLEKQLSAQLVAAAEFEVQDAERRFIAAARELAVRLLALDQQTALRKQQTQLASELSAFAKSRADKGELSPFDAAQAQVDAQRLLLEAKRLQTEHISLLGQLKPMLGLTPATSLTLTGRLPALVVPDRRGWMRRPDFQLAQAQITAAQTDTALAHAKRRPDITAGLFAAQERQQDMDSGYVGFRFSIPLPFWNKNEGEIAEKAATAERHRLEAEALAQQIASEADSARREMQAQSDLARETRDTLLPLVIEQTQKLENAYQSGQTDLITLLRAREQRLQLESAALDAERDFHLARIRYEAATASP